MKLYKILPMVFLLFFSLFSEASDVTRVKKKVSSKKNEKSNYSLNLGLSWARGLDELAHNWVTGTVSAGFFQKMMLPVNLSSGFRMKQARYTDEGENDILDLSISTTPRFLKFKIGDLGFSQSLSTTLPLAKDTKDSSLYTDIGYGLSTGFKLLGIGFTPSIGGSKYFYQYDTADKAGFIKNISTSLYTSLGISYAFAKWVSASTSLGHSTLFDFDNRQKSVNSIGFSLNFSFLKRYSISAYYSSRNRVVTYLPMFDDDNTMMGMRFGASIW